MIYMRYTNGSTAHYPTMLVRYFLLSVCNEGRVANYAPALYNYAHASLITFRMSLFVYTNLKAREVSH